MENTGMKPFFGRVHSSILLLLFAVVFGACTHHAKTDQPNEQSKPVGATQAALPDSISANSQAEAVLMRAPASTAPPPDSQLPDRILRSGHTGDIDAVAFSPDGHWLATGSADKTIRIWDLPTGRSLHILMGHTDAVWSLAFSRDGKRLASTSQDGSVRVWDAVTGNMLYTLNQGGVPTEAVFSHDGQFLIFASQSSTEEGLALLEICNAANGKKLRVITANWNHAYSLVATPNGHLLSSGGEGEDGDVDVTTKVWDLQTGKELKSLPISAQAISPDGRQIASATSSSEGTRIALYDSDSGKLIRTLDVSDQYVGHLVFAPEGSRLVGSAGSTIESWDTESGKELGALPGDNSSATQALAISSDGKFLAFANYSGYTTKVWDLATSRIVNTVAGNPSSGYLLFGRDGHLLVSEPKGLHIWDVASGEEISNYPAVAGGRIVISEDGTWLASNPQTNVRIWDTRMWAVANVTPAEGAHIWCMGFAGSKIPAGIASTGVQSWHIANNSDAPSLLGSTYAMATSPQGKFLAMGHARGGEVDVWDLTSGAKVTSFAAHKLSVNQLEFSPDGKFLLTAGQETPVTPAMLSAHQLPVESSVKLWDVGRWTPQAAFSSSTGEFSADSRYLAVSKDLGVIEVFDIAQSKTARVLTTQGYALGEVAFSPDGTWVAAFSQQGVSVWNIRSLQ
jgi:WD40 repeat protein